MIEVGMIAAWEEGTLLGFVGGEEVDFQLCLEG